MLININIIRNSIFLTFYLDFNVTIIILVNLYCCWAVTEVIFWNFIGILVVIRFRMVGLVRGFFRLSIFFSNHLYKIYCKLLSFFFWTSIVFFFHVQVQSHLGAIPLLTILIGTLIFLLNLLVLSSFHNSFWRLSLSSLN